MKLIFALIFFTLSCFAQGNRPVSLYRTKAEVVHPKTVELELFGSYFSAVSTYDPAGTETALAEDEAYAMMEGGAEVRYCFKIPLELRAGANGRMVSNVDGTTELTNQGLESFWAGAKYAMRSGKSIRYSLDLRYRITAYTNELYETEPSSYDTIELGDAGTEIEVGFNLAYYRNRGNSISGSAYYRMPPNNLSPEIFYNLELAWAFRNFALIFGTDGIFSLKQSEYTDIYASRPMMSTGVSEEYNSVNRAKVEPYAGFNIAFSSIRLAFKGSYVMTGVSTDRGYRFLASLVWSGKPKKGKHKERIRTFKEYEIEASVIKVSPRGKFVKIDQGIAHDVEKGMFFDIYKSDYFGGNVLLASGRVYEVGATWAIIKISKKYKNVELKPGLYARGI